MIPEIENKNSVASVLHRNLRLALRRRTWSFKRNARLEALMPRKPVRRVRFWRPAVVCGLLSLLLSRP